MKIVIYSINYAPELTGIGKYTGEMTSWFLSQGHDVKVVTAPPYYPKWKVSADYSSYKYRKEATNNPLPNNQYTRNIEARDSIVGKGVVYRCPLWVPAKPSGLKRIIHLASFAISSLPVMLIQSFWRPDVVIVIEPPLFCSGAAVLTACLSSSKTILHVQDFEVDAAFDMGLIRSHWLRRIVLKIERWLMRRFDKISTISCRMLQRLESKGVRDDKRMLFPNWVDTGLIYPMDTTSTFRNEIGLAQNDVVLLYSGNMGQKQGLELIIESARKLESDAHVKFVMCGQGAAYESLRNMAYGLKNIVWLPLQPFEKLNELLNMADIHLLPQRADAADLVMPSKLTGMLASGRPVIATAAEGTEVWSVVNGRGINTPPGDVVAFTATIQSLVDDAEERVRLGYNGRKFAEENLSTDAVLGRFEKELLRLTGNA